MTTTEKRIESCQKNLEKLYKKIERLTNFNQKKQNGIDSGKLIGDEAKWASWDIENNLDDIKKTEKEITEVQNKLDMYLEKDKEEKAYVNKNDVDIPALNDFLESYKDRCRKWYIIKSNKSIEKFNALMAEYDIIKTNDDAEFGEYHKMTEEEETANENLHKFFVDFNKSGSLAKICNPRKGTIDEVTLDKELDEDIRTKKLILIQRVNDLIGSIEVANCYVAPNGELNGVFEGPNGKCKVETISAGGYNIQCFHYRVLVKKLGNY